MMLLKLTRKTLQMSSLNTPRSALQKGGFLTRGFQLIIELSAWPMRRCVYCLTSVVIVNSPNLRKLLSRLLTLKTRTENRDHRCRPP